MSERSTQLVEKALQSYWELQIPCPFLVDQICSIYEVRPWVCSSVFSLSPSEWCDPFNKQDPNRWSMFPPDIEIPFYDKEASITPLDRIVPDTVHRILVGGFRYISDAQGLESIFQEVIRDEEIRISLAQYV